MTTVDLRAPQVNVDLQYGDPFTLNVVSDDTVPTTLEVWIALRQSAGTPLVTLTPSAITGGRSFALSDEDSLALSPSKAYQLVARDSDTGVTWFTGPVKPSTEGAPGPTSQTVSLALSEASITVELTLAAGVDDGGGGGVTDHGALTGLSDDDHTQYAKKASNLSDLTDAATARTNLGLDTAATSASSAFAAASHVHGAADITSGTMATARLGSGTANSSTFLRGDQTYAVPTVDVVSNVATSRILGRTTAGSGDSEELTAAQVRDLIRDASDWHVIYDDVLESAGSFTAPTWTSDYTDIEVCLTGRGSDTSNSSAGVRVRFNGDTGSNYFMNNGTAQTVWNNVGSMPGSQTNTDRQGLWVANIALGGVGRYTVADIRNVTWTSTATTGSAPTAPSAYYTNTSAAVTSIDVFLSVGTFTAGSRLTVRGRKAP